MIYLIHLHASLGHAKHYLGFVERAEGLASRFRYHAAGRGSRMLRAANERGITYAIVRVWPEGTRTNERHMKGGSSTRFCPSCNAKPEPAGYSGPWTEPPIRLTTRSES